MSGLNRQFMDNPENFLRSRAIVEALPTVPPPPRVVEFDLQPYEAAAAKIRGFVIGGRAGAPSDRILAYWLPWQPQGTSQIQLGEDADYFFTSQLAGCQIRIVPGAVRFGKTNHPQVLHIAGNVSSGTDPKGSTWRNQQASNALDAPALARSRALSSTGKGNSGYRGEGVNVVGYKKLSQWHFVGQQVDFDNLKVSRFWHL